MQTTPDAMLLRDPTYYVLRQDAGNWRASRATSTLASRSSFSKHVTRTPTRSSRPGSETMRRKPTLIFASNSIAGSMSDIAHSQVGCRTVAGAVLSASLPLKIPFNHARHLIEEHIAKSPWPGLMWLFVHCETTYISKMLLVRFGSQAHSGGGECQWVLHLEPCRDDHPWFDGTLRLAEISPKEALLSIAGQSTTQCRSMGDPLAHFVAASTARRVLRSICLAIGSKAVIAPQENQ